MPGKTKTNISVHIHVPIRIIPVNQTGVFQVWQNDNLIELHKAS